jgi:PD-(D/E)XK nuclease superfamily
VITASMLYDLVVCPHRPTMDLRADSANRDPTHPFVELLWERGNVNEANVIAGLSVPFVDLSAYETDEKERRTAEAMDAGAPLIYAGRIRSVDLLGVPDLLRREPCGYVPGDIKSGAGEEGPEDDSRPKPHYAVQLALYVDILERQGRLSERRGFEWDRHGQEVPYDLTKPQGKRGTLWQDYEKALALARGIAAGTTETRPAYAAPCKLCHWYSSCTARLKREDDLTLLPELGREKRDAFSKTFPTVKAFAAGDVAPTSTRGRPPSPGSAPTRSRSSRRERSSGRTAAGHTRSSRSPSSGTRASSSRRRDPPDARALLLARLRRPGEPRRRDRALRAVLRRRADAALYPSHRHPRPLAVSPRRSFLGGSRPEPLPSVDWPRVPGRRLEDTQNG